MNGASLPMNGLNGINPIPELTLKLDITFLQMLDVAKQLIAVVVLRINSQTASLKANIYVFGDQHHLTVWMSLLEETDVIENLVVVDMGRQLNYIIRYFCHQD